MGTQFSMWFCLVPFFLIMLAFMYLLLVATMGRVATRKLLPQLLGVYAIIVVVMTGLLLLPSADLATMIVDVGRLGVVLIVVPLVALRVRRTAQAGAVLLDLGQMRGYRLSMAASVIWFMLGLFSLVKLIVSGTPDAHQLLDVVFAFALGVQFGLILRQPIQLRERGLVYGFLLPWAKITGYEWARADASVLTLQVRRSVPLFQTLTFPVPSQLVADADQVLARHVAAP